METIKETQRLNFLLGEIQLTTPDDVERVYEESLESVTSNSDVDPDKRREFLDMLKRTRDYYLSKLEV